MTSSRRPRRSSIADAHGAREGRDRDLVRLYWPVELRPAFDGLFAIDDTLAEIVATASQPALGAIRLAWWREALARLDTAPPPPEPRLRAVAEHLLQRGVSGAEVAGIEDGWTTLLDEAPDMERVAARGERLFAIGAKLLGADDVRLSEAGGLFALGDVVRRGFGRDAEIPKTLVGHRFSRRLRPLTALARLATRDLKQGLMEPEATPGRAAALLAHRFFGRIA